MSLFKVREWWSTRLSSGDGNEDNPSLFDGKAFVVGNIDHASPSCDKIAVGCFDGYLRILQPRRRTVGSKKKLEDNDNDVETRSTTTSDVEGEGLKASKDHTSGYSPDDLLLEHHFDQPIIQLLLARLVPSHPNMIALAVLHPRRLSVYTVITAIGGEGALQLHKCYDHRLERTSCNMVAGSFGGVHGKDLLCVQSMDGVLIFYDQDSFAFQRLLPQFILPGPLCYCVSNDMFITCNSDRLVQGYSYQQLALSADADRGDNDDTLVGSYRNDRRRKGSISSSTSTIMPSARRLTPTWSLNLGEFVTDIIPIKYPFSMKSDYELIVLGERNLFVLSNDGENLGCIRLIGNVSCVSAYTVRSHEFDCSNLLLGSFGKSISIYSKTAKIWEARTDTAPVAIAVGRFGGLDGLLVTLDDHGSLGCYYLGTDPDTMVISLPDARDLDYETIDTELANLQRQITEYDESIVSRETMKTAQSNGESVKASSVLQVTTQVARGSFDSSQKSNRVADFDGEKFEDAITVHISFRNIGNETLENIQVSLSVPSPIIVNQSSFELPPIKSRATVPYILSASFRCQDNRLPSSLEATVSTCYLSSADEPRVCTTNFLLPMWIACEITQPSKSGAYQITLDTNRQAIQLIEIFDEVEADIIRLSPSSANVVGFRMKNNVEVSLLASKSSGRYRLISSTLDSMWLVLSQFERRMTSYFAHQTVGDASSFQLSYLGDLPLLDFAKLASAHLEQRHKLIEINEALSARAHQFRAIEKRLLAHFRDKNPTSLNHLDVLLEGTYHQIMSVGDAELEHQERLAIAANILSCGAQLFLILMRLRFKLSTVQFNVLQSCVSPIVHDSPDQGWEEVTDAAVTHLLRTCLARSQKDRAVPVQALKIPLNARKLEKHLALLCDRLDKGGNLYFDHQQQQQQQRQQQEPSKRQLLKSSSNDNRKQLDPESHVGLSEIPALSALSKSSAYRFASSLEPIKKKRPKKNLNHHSFQNLKDNNV